MCYVISVNGAGSARCDISLCFQVLKSLCIAPCSGLIISSDFRKSKKNILRDFSQ